MTQSDLFSRLGAPLKYRRQSWGAVRADGTIFLRVWQDQTQSHGGKRLIRVASKLDEGEQPSRGYKERIEHISLMRAGAKCYLVMCQADDVNAFPRTIKDFDAEYVFEAGSIVDLDGDIWVEWFSRIPVRDVEQVQNREQQPGGK